MRISPRTPRGFTLVELLTVIVIIMILVGMVIGAAGLASDKAKSNAAETDIRTLGLALEKYKQDNAEYPFGNASLDPSEDSPTTTLNPQKDFDPATYTPAILDMGEALYNPYGHDTGVPEEPAESYIGFKQLREGFFEFDSQKRLKNVVDPYGNSFGYSVARANALLQKENVEEVGYNPTYDLWSTGGGYGEDDVGGWITNW